MGFLADFVAFLIPYLPYLAVILIAVALFGVLRATIAGGSTASIFGLAIVFAIVGVMLWVSGYLEYSIISFAIAVLIALADGYHERRVDRRGYARMRG